jgi:hypothetical protein
MAFKLITDEIVLAAVDEVAGDGFCLVADLLPSLPKRTHADRRRGIQRSVSRGFLIERRGPDGREYVAISAEGWRLVRAAA